MVKKIVNILIMILLASSAVGYAADLASVVSPKGGASVCIQDTSRPKSKTAKPKKERVNIKKVTFENFDQCYERAMKYYNNQMYLTAAGLFEDLYPLSLGTPRADTILYTFAQCYYKNKDYNMAAFHFRDYVRRYPNTERTEDAFYYCISSIYNTSPDYYLDQSSTDYAIEKKKKKEYSYSPLMPEAVYYLVLNNYEYARKSVERKKIERYKACIEACERMERDYKDSKYYKETAKIAQEAQKQLQKLQAKS